MTSALVCWQCGDPLGSVLRPFPRLSTCDCGAELHVCRMCVSYDTRVAGSCREDRAEEVRDKESANFCDWFELATDAWAGRDDAAEASARVGLEALFGDGSGADSDSDPDHDARHRLEDLFRPGGTPKPE